VIIKLASGIALESGGAPGGLHRAGAAAIPDYSLARLMQPVISRTDF